ncbi:dUTP diphosphatase [bacterium]|nr:MAG: dUTP diphosphatase [bacterium]
MEIRIKLFPGGKIPERMSDNAVGFDIFARLDSAVTLKCGERNIIPAGFAIEVPAGFEAQIRPRSGLSLDYGLIIPNSPGTIDQDYRGEVKVIVANFGKEQITINNGDRIAQMIICPVASAELVIADELTESERGDGGFGSTGI